MADNRPEQAELSGNTLVLAAQVDQSARGQPTAELRQISERLSLAAEAARLGVWEWEVQTGRMIWTPELERIHGLDAGVSPVSFEDYHRYIHPDDCTRVQDAMAAAIDERNSLLVDYRIVMPDGSIRWLEARGRLFRDDSDRPERLVGVCMDISERKQAEHALLAQHRLTELLADVGLVLTRAGSLTTALQACAQAVVNHTDAAFARIWMLNRGEEALQLLASAGMYTHLDGAHGRIPVGESKIGHIAHTGRAHLSNDIAGDPSIEDQAWARREGVVAFAGYPLLVGDEVLGVLGMFARHRLSTADLQALGAVAHSLALAIQKMERDGALKRSEVSLRTRAAELARAAVALQRSNRELDAFAYAASHDLRAPLRGIANLAQWIEEDLQAQGGLKDETNEMLQLMRSRMHRMEALIEGLLAYSRAGRLRQKAETVQTAHLVREVVDLLSPPEDASIDIAPDLPTIETERLPLQQVFMNLIGNALKHAKRDRARIAIEAAESEDFYEFAIRDNGQGIEPEYHERIWGIFQTLESRDKVEGTGIGLALVKKIVNAAGGRAWVESRPGEGATFKFLWPRSLEHKEQE